ncbi:DEAD/DEAH box helicase, partial [Caldibacillus debilis]
VQSLNKKFCLLLTATPIQNKAEEIFHLVTLLKPGHLGTYSEFLGKFKRKNDIANDIRLKELVRKVMVRNRREDTHIRWPKRRVENIWLDFSREEQDLYQALSEFRSELSPHAFPAITLLREACSSREAVYVSLKNLWRKLDPPPADLQEKFREIVDKMGRIRVNSKAEKALELIGQIGEKVILFTEYRATQLYLQWFFKRHGISSVPYRGGFKRGKKDWMKELFQNHAQVFISTEAGGEGINLQFCRHIINFDLPWNPMRLEQRIGRIHRVGQEKDVVIYNFAVKDTIEEHMVNLLYEKIKIFERVIGELDDILMKLDAGPFQDYLQDALVHSTSEGEARIKLENLSSMIDFANGFKEGISREAAGNPPVS